MVTMAMIMHVLVSLGLDVEWWSWTLTDEEFSLAVELEVKWMLAWKTTEECVDMMPCMSTSLPRTWASFSTCMLLQHIQAKPFDLAPFL